MCTYSAQDPPSIYSTNVLLEASAELIQCDTGSAVEVDARIKSSLSDLSSGILCLRASI